MDSCHPWPGRDPAPPDRLRLLPWCQTESKDPLSPLLQPCLSTSLLPCHSFGSTRNAAGAGRSVAETCCCVGPHREEPQGPAELQSRSCRPLPPGPGQGRLGDLQRP